MATVNAWKAGRALFVFCAGTAIVTLGQDFKTLVNNWGFECYPIYRQLTF